jgi:hypothetical protein
MALTHEEKERIADNRMKIQSVAHSLTHIDPNKINDFEAIEECLEDAERNLAAALRSSEAPQRKRN